MRVKVEEDMPEGNGASIGRRSGTGLPVAASALRPFFRTAALPCPYVEGRTERKLITEIGGRESAGFYSELSRARLPRSHQLAYRPGRVGLSPLLALPGAAEAVLA